MFKRGKLARRHDSWPLWQIAEELPPKLQDFQQSHAAVRIDEQFEEDCFPGIAY